MISTEKFIHTLLKNKIDFFCGVPDSCLNNFINGVIKNKKKNIIAPNEGSAVAYGIGHYLKTKKVPLIYLQNSGIGNAADPLTSLCPKSVYSIPLVLLIGWRGSPRLKDEPQHKLTGKIITKLLKLFEIKTLILRSNKDLKKTDHLIKFSKKNKKPVALLIEPKTFTKISIKKTKKNENYVFRPYVIEKILQLINKKTKIISTVGYASREIYQIRRSKKLNNGKDFLMVGGMGHTAMTALGVSSNTKKNVLCIDGDGSFVMHMGGIATIGKYGGRNFIYILLDNNSHESVGVQPTISNNLNFKNISIGFGFKKYFLLKTKREVDLKLKKILKLNGPIFLHIKTKVGTLSKLVRPSNMVNLKQNFMKS